MYHRDYSYGMKDVPSASLQFHMGSYPSTLQSHVHFEDVLNPMKVTCLQKKYDVAVLRRLAKDNFEFGCKGGLETQHLTGVIEQLCSLTLISNRDLRYIAVRTAVTNNKVLCEDLEFNRIVERLGKFGSDIAKELFQWSQAVQLRYIELIDSDHEVEQFFEGLVFFNARLSALLVNLDDEKC